jgi:hypothetical protein
VWEVIDIKHITDCHNAGRHAVGPGPGDLTTVNQRIGSTQWQRFERCGNATAVGSS